MLTKKVSKTDDKFGCDPLKRPVEVLLNFGIINVDKPPGPTSHQVSAYVQKILGVKKSGHSGTLDPKVTGVLPVAIGRGTRVVQHLLSAGKEYVAVMHIHKEVDEYTARKVLAEFTGKISQLPPIKSAVKRQWRDRNIYDMEVLDVSGNDYLIRVSCQAGTYIRKLIHDIGQRLGCGANMAELRRIRAGTFTEEGLCTLQELTDAIHYYRSGNDKLIKSIIFPVEKAVEHLPKILVVDSAVTSICNGVDLKIPGISMLDEFKVNDNVAVMTLKGELIGTGVAKLSSKEIMEKDKGVAVSVMFVFMETGVYPKVSVS